VHDVCYPLGFAKKKPRPPGGVFLYLPLGYLLARVPVTGLHQDAIAGEACNTDEARAQLAAQLLLDIHMPGETSFEFLASLGVTGHLYQGLRRPCTARLRGALDYLLKPANTANSWY
jgi:hypothetical protein